jgi:hypothetical protein
MRYLKASASPSALAALERMLCLIDMRDILPSVRVPVVVMNRTADPVANVEEVVPSSVELRWRSHDRQAAFTV